jgi:C1A family cysteine protease
MISGVFALALVAGATAASERDLFFGQYVNQFGKNYTTPEELIAAKQCFEHNQKTIDRLNKESKTARHGWNVFTDMCPSDFKVMHNIEPSFFDNMKAERGNNYYRTFSASEVSKALADPVDWRTKGAVTAVKNQARCGSCWSFSATGNMEGQNFLQGTKSLVSLSEQELVSCSQSKGNQGCNGGLMDNAFKWVIEQGGITSESNYPYTSGNGNTGKCDKTKESPVAAKFSGYKDVQSDEDQMATWISTNGPLSVAVDAAQHWQTYTGGILTTCKGTQLDHGVLAVGYGTDNGQDYWIVKNSWGTSWGEQGYIRLGRGTNQCGIKSVPSSSQV